MHIKEIKRSRRRCSTTLKKLIDDILSLHANLRTNSFERKCGGTRTKLLNRMEGSMRHYNYHAKEDFTDTPKRKASLDMNNPAVINLDEENEMHYLGCSFFSGTGAVLKRACQTKNNVSHGSLELLRGQKVCSDNQSEADTKANGLKRGGIEEGRSHTPSKMQNEEEQKEAFKSLLAMEIKRQVLEGLGETGHSQVQDLQVMEIEDVASSIGVSTNDNSKEKNENNCTKPYIVKVKLLATVCIPIFLRQSSLEEQPPKQADSREEVDEKRAIFNIDSLLHSKEFSMCKPSQKAPENFRSQAELPQSMFEEQYNRQVLMETREKAEEQGVKYEKSSYRVPSSASIVNVDDTVTYSRELSKWRDRFGSDADLLVVNDFEVYDFDADKREDRFNEGQIWALYDDKDGMPRHYAQITEVHSLHPFEVSITWLEPKTQSMESFMWLTPGVSITCGAFELRRQQDPIKLTHVHHFSHAMKSQAGLNGEILVSPCKGEVWALYKDQIAFHSAPQRIGGKYELVQVVDKDMDSHTLTVVPLLKIAGFRTRFVQEQWPFKIAPKDFIKFSHQIPAYILKEEPRAYLELDPASTPKLYE